MVPILNNKRHTDACYEYSSKIDTKTVYSFSLCLFLYTYYHISHSIPYINARIQNG